MRKHPILRKLVLYVCLRLAFASKYTLVDNYEPSNFFSKFNFETGGDPTNGFVQYVNESYALSHGLIKSDNDYVTIGVDTTNVFAPNGGGRPSVRLSSAASYTRALYVLSLSHMPHGCGTWPAFWSLGPNWPYHGEIDIIEGVNTNTKNLMSLHTSNGCTIAGANQTGTLETSNCYEGVNNNAGCGVSAVLSTSYGSGFNARSGGVYAMEWTSEYIRVWFFESNNIPSTLSSANPDPATFGTPLANFQGSCDIDAHFGEHNIIFDITFCGDFAGNTYGSTSCPMISGASGPESCVDFVANNPQNFTEAYWKIGSLKVYQKPNEPSSASMFSTVSLSSATAAASTNSAVLSSLSNAGQGVDTTKTSITSSTLSLPESTPSSSTAMASSTYIGPNTVTIDTISTSSTSGVYSNGTYAPIWESSTQVIKTDMSSGWVTPYASSRLNTTRTTASQQHTQTGFSIPECHAFYSTAGGGLYRIYCNATIAGNDLRQSTVADFGTCIELCDLYNNTCTGVIFTNTSIPQLCTIKTSTSQNSTNVAKRAPLISWANDVYAALHIIGPSFSVPDDPSSSLVTSYVTSTTSSTVTTVSVITSTMTTTRLSPTCGSAVYTTLVTLCFTCALTPTVISTVIPISLPTCARTASTARPYTSSATSMFSSTTPSSTCPAQKSVTVTKLVQTTITTCVKPLICPAKSTAIGSGGGSTSYGPSNCSSGLSDNTVFNDAMGVQYQIFCSKAILGQPLQTSDTINIQSCMAACDMWNVMNFLGNDSCQAISYYSNGVSPNCRLYSEPEKSESQSGCDSGIIFDDNYGVSTSSSSTATTTSSNGMQSSSISHDGGSSYGVTTTGTNPMSTNNIVSGSGSRTELGTSSGSGPSIGSSSGSPSASASVSGTGGGGNTNGSAGTGGNGSTGSGSSAIGGTGGTGGNGGGTGGTGGIETGPATGAPATVTVTGPGSTVYVTQISTVVSYSVSYVYETQTEKVTATITPPSISSTSSKFCRTLATHYEPAVRRDSLFQRVDAQGMGYLGLRERQESW